MAQDPKQVKQPEPKKFKVTINAGEDEADKGDVFLAHNYRSVLIKRGEEVEIDEEFVNCLKSAVIETPIRDENGKTVLDKNGQEKTTRTQRFSFNLEAV